MPATLAAPLVVSAETGAEDLTVRRPAIVGLPDWSLAVKINRDLVACTAPTIRQDYDGGFFPRNKLNR